MKRNKLSQQVLGAMWIMLLLAGCVAPIATQTIPLATTTQELVGTWKRVELGDAVFYRFEEDGTLGMAYSLNGLDDQPYAVSSIQFEGAKMLLTEVSVFGVPPCGERVGSYEVQLLESGNIQVVVIEDDCGARKGSVPGEFEPVR